MDVGFIGLGRMGRGMVLNLLAAGHKVTVHDISDQAVASMVAAGAIAATDVPGVADSAPVVFTSLPGPSQVRDVVLGADGLLPRLRPGHTVVDVSTSSLELAHHAHTMLAERGAAFLDAPVSGGPAGAASRDLAFWVGGDRDEFDRLVPLLLSMGDKPHYCGLAGSGTTVKLVNNMLGHLFLASMAEAFSLGVRAGVDPLELWAALRLGVVGKRSALHMLTQQFLPAEFEPAAFSLDLALKDVELAAELGRELDVPMPLSSTVIADMRGAGERGWGSKDCRIYLTQQLERARVEIAVDPKKLQSLLDEPASSQ